MLLGLSSPRFAQRLYLGPDGHFVSLRRRNILIRNAPAAWAPRTHPISKQNRNIAQSPYAHRVTFRDYIDSNSVVGDCLLKPPSGDRFAVLQSELGLAYGENRVVHGVPYVGSFGLSGACAQSVLFMASALRHECSQQILGTAELSRTAVPETSELPITGLSPWRIQSVGRALGLNIPVEVVEGIDLSTRQDAVTSRDFAVAIAAYLQAEVPVIVPVNLRRLANTKVYDQLARAAEGTGAWEVMAPGQFPDELHCVLVVGHDREWPPKRFLVMDPISVPFLVVEAGDLHTSAVSCREILRAKEGGWRSRRLQDSPALLPVLPGSVCASLNTEISPADNDGRPQPALGVLFQLHALMARRGMPLPPAGGPSSMSLLPASELMSQLAPGSTAIPSLDAFIRAAGDQLVWAYSFSGQVFVVRAEKANVTISRGALDVFEEQCFVGMGSASGPIARRPHPWAPTQFITPRRRDTPLRGSILTSCSPYGLHASLQMIPKDCDRIDLYAFMQRDISVLLGDEQESSAVSAMAKLDRLGRPSVIAEVAQRIDRAIQDVRGDIKITGIASFVPEISSHDEFRRKEAVAALRFLSKLVRVLNEPNRERNGLISHEIRAIEVVGGNLIDGLWLGELDEDQAGGAFPPGASPVANWVTGDENWDRIGRCLERVIAGTPECDTPFAFELEPGPLCAIRGLDDLARIVRLASVSASPARVGLNLDIAHLAFLSDIEPQDLRDRGLVGQIVHAHVSDHTCGHLSDMVIGTRHGQEEYEPWFELLREAKRSGARFSGVVGLELEAAVSDEALATSWDRLKSLL